MDITISDELASKIREARAKLGNHSLMTNGYTVRGRPARLNSEASVRYEVTMAELRDLQDDIVDDLFDIIGEEAE